MTTIITPTTIPPNTIPKWREPKNEDEATSLILDIALWLQASEDGSVRRELALKRLLHLVSHSEWLSNNQYQSMLSILRAYRSEPIDPHQWIPRLITDFTARVKRIKASYLDKGRSVVVWHEHQLVYWHIGNMYSVLNPEPKVQLPVVISTPIDWKNHAVIVSISGAILTLITLMEMIIK